MSDVSGEAMDVEGAGLAEGVGCGGDGQEEHPGQDQEGQPSLGELLPQGSQEPAHR